ncbi:hypothetical protein LIER_02788 [Lithospermum erythrorhizon]|uniref:SBP-type domain-containing protein n=1 Tax=Lithospermum erythrorhizon TaxID=34254 RepID=A0AAV3NRF6_LITER
MEDAGAQVASPIFIHQAISGRFIEPHSMAKKRSLPFPSSNFIQQQNHPNNWNPNAWNWNSVRFVAKPSEFDSVNRLNVTDGAMRSDQSKAPDRSRSNHTGEDEESLRLKLGGSNSGVTSNVEPVSRPCKRVRSGSPGCNNYPMCQVDDCKEDLSRAKDYHRRHKVCEVHSKVTKALVGNQMQRFCQQCSRFHPLLEFDEGKRSCRRRLAGHNRRRRKIQPEDSASHVVLNGNQESTDKNDMDIVNLFAALASAQGHADERGVLPSAVPDKEQLLQILKKLHSLPLPANIAEKIPNLGSSGNSISNQSSSQTQSCVNANTLSPSTKNLLAALSATPATPSTDVLEVQSEGSRRGSDSEKSKYVSLGQSPRLNQQHGLPVERPIVGERSSSNEQSPVEESDFHVQETHPDLTLQLYSSSPEIDSIPKLSTDRKYFSSGSSNPSVDRSPSSSPPVAQKLFPVPSIREKGRPKTIPLHPVAAANVSTAKAAGCTMPLQLFGRSSMGADNGSSQYSPYQAGYTSSSGSDHSPSSLISDAQDRTGRILFKLFGKDPSHLPSSLRAQVYNWLSNSPSEMESYIRPGCIVLSIYVSMSSSAWDQLEGNLYQCIKSLVKDIDSDFWRNGRFLVHTPKQLASYQEGKVRLCKSWKPWTSPELVSVSPVAVVPGQESSVVLRGRNLTIPGIKISCTHMAIYTNEQVALPTSQLMSDEICLSGFKICGADDKALGRCFIEVENGVRGSSVPLIIADAAICQELGHLEVEFAEGAEAHDLTLASHVQDSWVSNSREETLHFLNELGWVFQRKSNSCLFEAPAYKLSRFKFLFVFSVEHDFCALVKTLLDILLEINLAKKELTNESLEMLYEIHLLNRAVKRRCMNMVNLLLHYSALDFSDNSQKYIFQPNALGPGGITPLHVAASMSNSDNLVDSLTNDPQEIGMRSWNSTLDSTGLSPYAYALLRNNHSYNDLVAQKLADTENGQISLSIHNELVPLELEKVQNKKKLIEFKQVLNSCSKCAIAAARSSRRVSGTQGLLQRPYIHSMLAIAAVCVCVCLLFRGAPDIGSVAPFKWEKLEFGTS